jgi:hypothetical protein
MRNPEIRQSIGGTTWLSDDVSAPGKPKRKTLVFASHKLAKHGFLKRSTPYIVGEDLTVGSSGRVNRNSGFRQIEVRDVGCTNSRCPKPRNAKKICAVDLRKESNHWILLGMDVGT